MDFREVKNTLVGYVTKYRYPVLILLVGMGLMFLPQGEKTTREESSQIQPGMSTEERLEQILCQVDGVGKVYVMLTESDGGVIHYQMDEDLSADGNVRMQTVITTDSDRAQTGLVTSTDAPRYMGAIIVCEGGNMASVRLAVTQATANITGLTSDRITVLKMK